MDHCALVSHNAMAILLQAHAFAGNPTRSNRPQSMSPSSAHESLKSLLAGPPSDVSNLNFKVLVFKNGKPLATSLDQSSDSPPKWRLGWSPPSNFKDLSADSFVYLGEESETVYWAIDASNDEDKVSKCAGGDGFCFVELRTLMVATDWADAGSMGELAIAGHVGDSFLIWILCFDVICFLCLKNLNFLRYL